VGEPDSPAATASCTTRSSTTRRLPPGPGDGRRSGTPKSESHTLLS